MAHPHFHAVSSARKHGGTPDQYVELHSWFDASKEMHPDFRHRGLRHHAQGIFEAERVFGKTLTINVGNGKTKQVPVRVLGEQHVTEDLGFIPTLSDWLRCIKPEPWMNRSRKLSRELEREEQQQDVA